MPKISFLASLEVANLSRETMVHLFMWSDRADDTDAFWCGQCSVVSNASSPEYLKIVATDSTATYVMAKNSPHLSVRWTQPLCVSSSIQQSPNFSS